MSMGKDLCAISTHSVVVRYSGEEVGYRRILARKNGGIIQDVRKVEGNPHLLVITFHPRADAAFVIGEINLRG